MAAKHKVWRFQRSHPAGNVVTAMTHDRQWAMHFYNDAVMEMNFRGRFTFYAVAMVAGTAQEPRLRVLREVTEREWK